jgi:ribosomal protein S18 acetylase RimI-like enzyme
MRVENVKTADIKTFKWLVEEYWRELMPKATAMQTPETFDAQFQNTFEDKRDDCLLHIAFEGDQPVGLFLFQIASDQHQAAILEFYVRPQNRRKGVGSAMVHWLLSKCDDLGIEQIDLNVRRDNPDALAFWQAQGFGIAGYRLRQLRDPATRSAFKEVLSSDF